MFPNGVYMSAVGEPAIESSVHDLFFHGVAQSFDWHWGRAENILLSQTFPIIVVNVFLLQILIVLAFTTWGAGAALLNISIDLKWGSF